MRIVPGVKDYGLAGNLANFKTARELGLLDAFGNRLLLDVQTASNTAATAVDIFSSASVPSGNFKVLPLLANNQDWPSAAVR